jgi:hypothetical protein
MIAGRTERHKDLLARADAARARGDEARERAEILLARGDGYAAAVLEKVATTQELIAANAELALARLAVDREGLNDFSTEERIARTLAARRRALEFAALHRDRGQIRRAHFHEAAAQGMGIAARIHAEFGPHAEEGERAAEADRSVQRPVPIGRAEGADRPLPIGHSEPTNGRAARRVAFSPDP